MNKNTTGTIQGNENTTWLIAQLKKAEEQYPVQTLKEERDMIKQFKNNRDQLNRHLFLHNIPLVFNIAKKYKHKTSDFDGMVQSGFAGLGEAAKRFDVKRRIKFVTYAYPWVRKYILADFYRKGIEIDNASISLNQFSAASKDDNGTELEEFVSSYLDPVCNSVPSANETLSAIDYNELCSDLFKTMDNDTSLSSTDKEVFKDLFYSNDSPRTIATNYGISVTDVNQIKKRILGKFRERLEGTYNITEFQDI